MSQQINLYNPIFLKRKKHFSARTMLQSLAVIVAGALAFYAYALYQTAALKRAATDLEARAKEQREQLVRLGRDLSPQGRSKLLEGELARAEGRLQARQRLMERLRTEKLGSVEGFSQYLVAFARQSVPGVWLTGIAIGDAEGVVSVRGRALQAHLVPLYLRALSSEAVMQGRAVAELRLSASRPAAEAGAGAAQKGKAPEGKAPDRYVEFSVLVPRRSAEPRAPASRVGS